MFGGPAWQWEPRRRQFYLHHFLAAQPQLNLRNEQVLDALLAAGRFWLERGVDGFRLDAIDFLLHDPLLRDNPARPPGDGVFPAKLFRLQHHIHDMLQPGASTVLQRIRALIDEDPGTTTLAEVSSQDGAFERVARYTAEDRHLHMAYTLRPLRRPFDRATLLRLIADIAKTDPRGWIAWSFSNHDMGGAVSRWGGASRDPDFARLLMGLLLSLRGSACIYQGEELGLPDATVAFADMQDPFGIAYYPEYRGRDGSRTPLPWQAASPHAGFSTARPWLPVDPAHLPLSVDQQEADRGSVLWACRRFLAWRKTHPALIDGDIAPIGAPAPLVAFRRVKPEESILVVLNTAAEPALVPERLRGTRILYGHDFDLDDRGSSLSLPRYGMLFAAAEPAPAQPERSPAFEPAT